MIYGQLAQLVSVLFNSYREVTSSIPAEAFIFNCNFFMLYYIREVVPRSLRSPRGVHGVYGESTESPRRVRGVYGESTESMESPRSLWRVHRESSWNPWNSVSWSPHGIHCISDSPSRLYGESMKTPHGLLMDSTQSPCRLLGTSRKWTMESSETPHGVSVEFSWSPWGVSEESTETSKRLRGVHGNAWGSVKYSKFGSKAIRKFLANLEWLTILRISGWEVFRRWPTEFKVKYTLLHLAFS